jgi:Cytosolic carboxypeptidase N-terminal domain
VVGAKGVPLTLQITNAGRSSFPEAWPGYKGCASYTLSPDDWFRVDTIYDPTAGILTLKHTPEKVTFVSYLLFSNFLVT